MELPIELIIYILQRLDCASLCICKQACSLFYKIINETPILQYIISLEIAGQVDPKQSYGHGIDTKTSARLSRYMEHWDQLKWTSEETGSLCGEGPWELYGNVLASGDPQEKLFKFKQLPSGLREIDTRVWSVGYPPFAIDDFGMDPSQDLLVLIQTPNWYTPTERIRRFHLQKLSTGEIHPLALDGGYIEIEKTQRLETQSDSSFYEISVFGPHLGVQIGHSLFGLKEELFVWNWKTGELKLHLTGYDLCSFAFISECHVLVASSSVSSEEAFLKVFNFEDAKRGIETDLTLGSSVTTLALPHLDHEAVAVEMRIQCDPSPVWDPSLNPPFYTAPDQRLFVITLCVEVHKKKHAHKYASYALLLPLSTLRKHIDNNHGHLDWEAWGPNGSRLIEVPLGPNDGNNWICFVHGVRYVVPRKINRKRAAYMLDVYDFNQTIIGYTQIRDPEGSKLTQNAMHVVTEPTTILRSQRVFRDKVETHLPYRHGSISWDRPSGWLDGVLMSEDSIVVVNDDCTYTLLNF